MRSLGFSHTWHGVESSGSGDPETIIFFPLGDKSSNNMGNGLVGKELNQRKCLARR